MARSEVGAAPAGARRWLGGSRDRGGLRALAGCPVGVECLPGLKSTTANLSSGQFNVFARLEVLDLLKLGNNCTCSVPHCICDRILTFLS